MLEILSRVRSQESSWGEATLAALNHQCPLSLMVNFESLKKGATMTVPEVIAMEFELCIHLMVTNRANFEIGVEHLLR
jgi:hypothetical protein